MSKISLTIDGITYDVEIELHQRADAGLSVIVDGERLRVTLPELGTPEPAEWLLIDGRPYEVGVDHNLRWIKSSRAMHRLEIRDRDTAVTRPASADSRVKAPIPGQITRVLVKVGDQVEAGQPLLVLEAMKMENQVRAPRAGTVGQLNASAGQAVTLNALLAEIV